jgi:hypothetical protein
MHSSPIRFGNPVWDLRDVIGWVLDRDPAKFGRLMNEIDVETAVHVAKFYTRWPRPECDANAPTTLLHALQRGDLAAHDGDTALPREYWGSRTTRDFRPALRLAIWFWSCDVLRLWPEAGGPPPPAAEPKEAVETTRARGKRGPKRKLRDSLGAKMLDDLSSGRRTPEELKGDKLSALATQYGGSPNTANAARQDALSRFSEFQNSRSNKL